MYCKKLVTLGNLPFCWRTSLRYFTFHFICLSISWSCKKNEKNISFVKFKLKTWTPKPKPLCFVQIFEIQWEFISLVGFWWKIGRPKKRIRNFWHLKLPFSVWESEGSCGKRGEYFFWDLSFPSLFPFVTHSLQFLRPKHAFIHCGGHSIPFYLAP